MINYALVNYILWLIAIGITCTTLGYLFLLLASLLTEFKK